MDGRQHPDAGARQLERDAALLVRRADQQFFRMTLGNGDHARAGKRIGIMEYPRDERRIVERRSSGSRVEHDFEREADFPNTHLDVG